MGDGWESNPHRSQGHNLVPYQSASVTVRLGYLFYAWLLATTATQTRSLTLLDLFCAFLLILQLHPLRLGKMTGGLCRLMPLLSVEIVCICHDTPPNPRAWNRTKSAPLSGACTALVLHAGKLTHVGFVMKKHAVRSWLGRRVRSHRLLWLILRTPDHHQNHDQIFHSLILKTVGVAGIEPATPWTPSKCATRLR
jgi:hypothetical protein